MDSLIHTAVCVAVNIVPFIVNRKSIKTCGFERCARPLGAWGVCAAFHTIDILELGQATLSWIIAPPQQIPPPEVPHNAGLCIVLGYCLAPRFIEKLLGHAIANSV
jgi:hypothetical protein